MKEKKKCKTSDDSPGTSRGMYAVPRDRGRRMQLPGQAGGVVTAFCARP